MMVTTQRVPATLAPFDVGNLALPPEGFQSVDLESAGGAEGRRIVKRIKEKLLPAREALEKKREAGLART